MVMVSNAPDPGCGNQKPKNPLRIFEMKTESPEIMMIVAYEPAERWEGGQVKDGQRGDCLVTTVVTSDSHDGPWRRNSRHSALPAYRDTVGAQPSSESSS